MSASRREALAGALLFLVAFAIRAAYVASIAGEAAVRYPVLDALAYHEWALAILDGGWLGDRVYYQDPLYPFFLAGLYAVFGSGSLGVLLARAPSTRRAWCCSTPPLCASSVSRQPGSPDCSRPSTRPSSSMPRCC